MLLECLNVCDPIDKISVIINMAIWDRGSLSESVSAAGLMMRAHLVLRSCWDVWNFKETLGELGAKFRNFSMSLASVHIGCIAGMSACKGITASVGKWGA